MKMHFDFAAWTDARLLTVERALDAWVPQRAPAGLGDGMRYAVLDGGKRLRPLLVLAARESVAQGDTHEALDEAALRAACSVELIHAYSLVHDDMPCMDNDILRRGKPTVHVKFGEAGALLAGDALQALAFEILTPQDSDIPAEVQVRLCQRLARAAARARRWHKRTCTSAGMSESCGVRISKASACRASPASKAPASPNLTWTVGLPRRKMSLSMQGMSSCTKE